MRTIQVVPAVSQQRTLTRPTIQETEMGKHSKKKRDRIKPAKGDLSTTEESLQPAAGQYEIATAFAVSLVNNRRSGYLHNR
jgi:hypothetical protein